MIVMTLVIAVLIVFVVGLFAFELNRVEVARAQLRSATEAAALTAVATLASQQSGNTMVAHTTAVATALNAYRQNEVIGVEFDGIDPDDPGIPAAVQAPANPYNPPIPKQASLFIEFLDPNSNPPNQVVAMGNPAGKAIRCYGTFHYVPAFGNFVGVGNTFLRAMSTGGVPDLDVVLTFDVSGSIDDQTPVTFVKRFRKSGNTTMFVGDDTPQVVGGGIANRYWVCDARAGSPAGTKAQGRMYDILLPCPVGTGVNAYYPHQLQTADDTQPNSDFGGQPYHTYPLTFSSNLRNTAGNTGTLPGNDPTNGSSADEGDRYTFSDMVVNINGQPTFSATSAGGFSFPHVAVLVEAARGNLENQAVFASSGAQLAFQQLNINVSPAGGYQTAYINAAKDNLQPIADARAAAIEFFTLMNTNTKGHFGFVSFSSNSGTPGGTYGPVNNIASNYAIGGTMSHPQPLVALNPGVGQSGYTQCISAISSPPLVATGGTNIGASIDAAVQQLQNNGRPTAKKAIVVFTDGMPNTPGGNRAGGEAHARAKALDAKNAGIPIYTIGLAQNAAIIPFETAILTDQNSNPTTGGVAGIAGNGGRFFLVTNSADLKKIFGNIARSLCGLVK